MQLGHATHDDWRMATELALAQIGRFDPPPPDSGLSVGLSGLVYVSEALAGDFESIMALVTSRQPAVDWVGACVPGVIAGQGEYQHEPAVALLAGRIGLETQSIDAPLAGHSAGLLVLADPRDSALVPFLRRAGEQLGTTKIFGGIVADTGGCSLWPPSDREGRRALAIRPPALAASGVTVGLTPLAPAHRITSLRDGYLETIDHRPAMEVLLQDLKIEAAGIAIENPAALVMAIRQASPQQGLLVGTSPSNPPPPPGLAHLRLGHLVGIEPQGSRVAITDAASPEDRFQLLTPDATAARADLIRVCTALRESLELVGRRPRAAHYVSCVARGRSLFGSSGTEAELIAHNLGDVPLIGFFGNGEIGDARYRSYSGVLTVIA